MVKKRRKRGRRPSSRGRGARGAAEAEHSIEDTIELTARQEQYLAFVCQYMTLLDRAPTETEVAEYFGVSGASAHQMFVVLESKGALWRFPRVARSLRPAVDPAALPLQSAPGASAPTPAAAWSSFGTYLAHRLAAGDLWGPAKFMAILRLDAVLEDVLREVGAPRALLDRTRRRLQRLAKRCLGEPAASPRAAPAPTPARESQRAPRVAKPKVADPNQGSLF